MFPRRPRGTSPGAFAERSKFRPPIGSDHLTFRARPLFLSSSKVQETRPLHAGSLGGLPRITERIFASAGRQSLSAKGQPKFPEAHGLGGIDHELSASARRPAGSVTTGECPDARADGRDYPQRPACAPLRRSTNHVNICVLHESSTDSPACRRLAFCWDVPIFVDGSTQSNAVLARSALTLPASTSAGSLLAGLTLDFIVERAHLRLAPNNDVRCP